MEIAAKVPAVLAVLTSLLIVAESQNYYPSPGGQFQQEEKLVEHIIPIKGSSFLPAVPVYSSPVNSYGNPAQYYRSAMTEGCQSPRQARGLYLAPYPARQQNYQQYQNGLEGSWYHSTPMGYQPAMRSAPWAMAQPEEQSYYQQSYYQQPEEPAARSSKTFGPLRDLLPNIFSSDNEHVQNDMAYQVPQQNYNSVPTISSSPSAPIQTYY
ncbi:Hypothetical protein NTJ_00228 [Nesidiocoris tenuis]|nr:Hypothetical protein NTJ_00228 [Nesidiocoris tenuis]